MLSRSIKVGKVPHVYCSFPFSIRSLGHSLFTRTLLLAISICPKRTLPRCFQSRAVCVWASTRRPRTLRTHRRRPNPHKPRHERGITATLHMFKNGIHGVRFACNPPALSLVFL